MHGFCPDTGVMKEVSHKIGVAHGAAKGERPVPAPFTPLLEGILSPRRRGHGPGQRLFVEPAASPRNVAIIDLIWNAEVVKRDQKITLDAFDEIASVHEVFATQRQQVPSIGSFRRGSQTQEE